MSVPLAVRNRTGAVETFAGQIATLQTKYYGRRRRFWQGDLLDLDKPGEFKNTDDHPTDVNEAGEPLRYRKRARKARAFMEGRNIPSAVSHLRVNAYVSPRKTHFEGKGWFLSVEVTTPGGRVFRMQVDGAGPEDHSMPWTEIEALD